MSSPSELAGYATVAVYHASLLLLLHTTRALLQMPQVAGIAWHRVELGPANVPRVHCVVPLVQLAG